MATPDQVSPILWTPELLLGESLLADHRYRELLAQFPPGTFNEERNRMRERSEAALQCAAWMESVGLTEARWVGPFGNVPKIRGTKVLIRAGARVFGTGGVPREGMLTKRATWVKVHSINQGYSNDPRIFETAPAVRQPEVHWAGSGGYWRWTDLNSVIEFSDESPRAAPASATASAPGLSM